MLCVYKGRATLLSDSLMFLKDSSCPRVFSWFSNESSKKKKKTIDLLGSQRQLYLAAVKFDSPDVCRCSQYLIQTNAKTPHENWPELRLLLTLPSVRILSSNLSINTAFDTDREHFSKYAFKFSDLSPLTDEKFAVKWIRFLLRIKEVCSSYLSCGAVRSNFTAVPILSKEIM